MDQPGKQNTKTSSQKIDVSACLEAVNMYNADFHRERDNYCFNVPLTEGQIVPLWEHLWWRTVKMGTRFLGNTLMVVICLSGVLVLANVAKNAYDVDRAQPIEHHDTRIDLVTNKPYEYFWTEKSQNPLPDDYWQNNTRIYEILVFAMVAGYIGSGTSFRRSRKIRVGVPLTPAKTAHLPASKSLVRASAEPAADSLMRASSEAEQAHRGILLRGAQGRQEEHAETLVRASVGGP